MTRDVVVLPVERPTQLSVPNPWTCGALTEPVHGNFTPTAVKDQTVIAVVGTQWDRHQDLIGEVRVVVQLGEAKVVAQLGEVKVVAQFGETKVVANIEGMVRDEVQGRIRGTRGTRGIRGTSGIRETRSLLGEIHLRRVFRA